MSDLIKKLNKNKIFKFVASIRLAVPLMLILGACVAYGTILESNYNSEYASMAIYKSTWFGGLLILLWINIFAATISRIPFKQHHTGFVITHIGLLTFLIGGYITNSDGLDGQLVIPENKTSSTVTLPHLMLGYQFENNPSTQILKFKKTIFAQDEHDLKDLNDNLGHLMTVKAYVPFAKIEKEYLESPDPENQSVALSFILRSDFFTVTEWLHSEVNPLMKMGPATLKIIKVADLDKDYVVLPKENPSIKQKTLPPSPPQTPSQSNRAGSPKSSSAVLIMTSLKDPTTIKKIPVADLAKKKLDINGLSLQLIKLYQHAVVSDNKMTESRDSEVANPAVEFFVEKDGKKVREVLYAKFSGFALNKEGLFGYKFSFESPDVIAVNSTPHGSPPADTASDSAPGMSPAQAAMGGGNTVVFAVAPQEKSKVRITLIKNNKVVMSEILNEGQSLQTPWMGMKVFLGAVKSHAVERVVATPVTPERGQPLPASALRLSASADPKEDFWLAEGEQKELQLAGKNAVVYFGRQTFELPFELKLEKFSKVDYPGTTTPMSFESNVQVGNTGISQRIAMNDPLKVDGYTIYQASYSVTPEETVSIFSVNRDPGRIIKYSGSLILGLGIIIITLMRSRFWKFYLQRGKQNA